MKRNTLFAVLAIVLSFAMIACRPTTIVVPVPDPGNDHTGGSTVLSASEAMSRISSGLDLGTLLYDAGNAQVDGNKVTVDVTGRSFTDSENGQWTATGGTLVYTFSNTATTGGIMLFADGTSYSSYTVATDPEDPIILVYANNTYTYVIAETAAECSVSIDGSTVTVNSITEPVVSGTINGSAVASPSTEVPVTTSYVSSEESLTAALARGGEIVITGGFTVSDTATLAVAVDGTHIYSTSSSNPVVVLNHVAANGVNMISVTADDVVIEGVDFSFTGDNTAATSSSHILKALYDGEEAITGLVIRDAVFKLGTGAGLNLHGTRNADLDNVTVEGSDESRNVALTISDSTGLTVSGSFDNGTISVGGGNYKFADIQINYSEGDAFYDNKVSSVTFEDIGDSVVYATEASTGENVINGLGEGIRFVNTNEAGYYYNAPSDWDYLMSADAKTELRETYVPALFSMFNEFDGTSSAQYHDSDYLRSYFDDTDPYLDLGDHGVVTSVTLFGEGGTEYKVDDGNISPYAISIGMNHFYKDTVAKVDEDGHLLINKAWLVFSLLYSDTIYIDDTAYTCSLYGEPERLAIESVTYNGATVPDDNDGVYNIVLEDSISRIAYTYVGQGEGSDNVFILTEDVDGSVSQISIESSDTADFGSYPIPYGVDITEEIKTEYDKRHSKKIGYVLDESGNPGRFELDIAISFAEGM